MQGSCPEIRNAVPGDLPDPDLRLLHNRIGSDIWNFLENVSGNFRQTNDRCCKTIVIYSLTDTMLLFVWSGGIHKGLPEEDGRSSLLPELLNRKSDLPNKYIKMAELTQWYLWTVTVRGSPSWSWEVR
ncbi:UNVERIFIED_CONTAM: hypothetical protein PYX00_003508 [Menopon gallinae]|uniref:Uncharacterized protein n=1 Tax=Menopon gallinae TaxID=328185 RepID=A0AAW2I261_9NEOP